MGYSVMGDVRGPEGGGRRGGGWGCTLIKPEQRDERPVERLRKHRGGGGMWSGVGLGGSESLTGLREDVLCQPAAL